MTVPHTRPGRRPGWRDGLFLAVSCAGFAAAAHATGTPRELPQRLLGGPDVPTLGPEALIDLSLPLLLAAAALLGPAIIRWRWQAAVLLLGTGWIGLVGLALLQERSLGQSFDVLSCAIGFAGLVAAALALKPRAAGSVAAEAAPADSSGEQRAAAAA